MLLLPRVDGLLGFAEELGQFGIRAGQGTEMMQASFESEYAAAADKVLTF